MEEEQGVPQLPEDAPVETVSGGKKSRLIWILPGAAILILLAGAIYYFYFMNGSGLPGNIVRNNAGAVALVNGEQILKESYEARLAKEAAMLKAGGTDANLDQKKLGEQVLDNLIAEKLLLQKAKEKGITTTPEEIDAIVERNRKQLATEEAFQKALEAEGISLEKFRDIIFEQITIQKFIESSLDFSNITASKEEIQANYDQSIVGSDKYPKLDEVRGQIESFVIQNKKQGMIIKFIQDLRNASKIELML